MTIPEHTRCALDAYAKEGVPVGGFLFAVLSNDLFGAVGHADDANYHALGEIVKYVYNNLPMGCHGSEKAVEDWLAQRSAAR